MTWNEASELLANIEIGQHLDPARQYKIVLAVNHPCNTYDYGGEHGFLIRIGQRTTIEIPFSMLQSVFDSASANGGVYNRGIINELYPTQVQHHGCHVHTVGKLFSNAEVMAPLNARNYLIQD